MIQFPQIHIATSVVNRLLNAVRDVDSLGGGGQQMTPPVPNAAPLGEAIESAATEPVGDVTPTDPAMVKDLTEGSLFP